MNKEFTQYITPDGRIYNFDAHDKFLISETGFGMPDIEYQTQRGPFQHGETALDYRLKPRIIQIIHRINACNRQEYYDDRNNFLNFIRPNRQLTGFFTPGILRKVLPNGTRYDLKVFLEKGPEFIGGSQDKWDEWSVHETIRFIAPDPIFYNPSLVTVNIGGSSVFNLWEFPLVFPKPMGRDFLVDPITTITYTGTWMEYPGIVITGPVDGPVITNTTTGETISMLYNVIYGETITFNLSYGNKSVVSSIAGDILWTIKDTNDLATFHLAPDPEAALGNNVILISAGAWSIGTSRISFQYHNRYIGL